MSPELLRAVDVKGSSMRLFEAIPELINRSGLRTIFGTPGSSNVPWLAHGVATDRLTYVGTRHEAAAVTAAAAYSKVTGDVGIATVSLGPGFANTVNSIAAAVHDHIPLVVMVGQSPSRKLHGDLQSLNQREIAAALGVPYHQALDAGKVEAAYWAAFEAARWNGSVQIVSIDEEHLEDRVRLDGQESPAARPTEAVDPDAVGAVVDLLARARKPLLLAGRGADLAGCREDLIELAELTGARVACTMPTLGMFTGHPRDLGICGQSSSPVVAEELYDTDAVIAVGASLNSFTTREGSIFPAAKIVQCEIDVDRDFKASSPELGLLGDARDSVRALVAEWRRRELSPVSGAQAPSWPDVRASMMKVDLGHDPTRGVDPRELYAWLDDELPDDRVVVVDGGRASYPIPAMVRVPDQHSFVAARGYGSVGLGLGAAIGAAMAEPSRRLVLFTGDGGFLMSSHELDTIRAYDLDVTIVIMNDQQYGSELKYLDRLGLPHDVARLSMPDLDLLARAYGGRSLVVESPEDFPRIVVDQPGLYIVDVRIDPLVNPATI